LLLLPELLRNALASLALARRPVEPSTVLQELQSTWRRSRCGGSGKRSSRSGTDDLRELGRGDRDS